VVLLLRLIANVDFRRTSLSSVGSRDDQDRSRRGPQYVCGDAAQPQAIYPPEPTPADRDEGGLSAFFGRLQDDRGCFALPDFIVDETLLDVPDAVIEEMEAAWLREAIGRLPQKARYVLVRRYGLDDRDPLTLAELAAELKLSRERVRQLQHEAEFLLKSGARRVPRHSVA
jgi:RNA polymerase sigma factor (sigma-70 family)